MKDYKNYLGHYIDTLRELGMDIQNSKEELLDMILGLPGDMLEEMLPECVVGTMFDYMKSNQVFSFDTEAFNVGRMYADFLEKVAAISHGELTFTQIEEIQEAEETIDSYGLECSMGICSLSFYCNGKPYSGLAEVYNDWFDTGVLPFINQVIQEQDTGKALYCTGDGAQNLIVFYVSDDWAERFNEKAEWIELKKL